MSDEKALEIYKGDLGEIFGGGTELFWTSIEDDGSRATKAKIMNAIDVAESFRDVKSAVAVKDIIVHTVEFVNEDGEIVQAPRVVFVSPDGKSYASVSNGIISSLKKIFGLFGLPPWNPPLKIMPKEVKTRRGFRTLRIEVVE